MTIPGLNSIKIYNTKHFALKYFNAFDTVNISELTDQIPTNLNFLTEDAKITSKSIINSELNLMQVKINITLPFNIIDDTVLIKKLRSMKHIYAIKDNSGIGYLLGSKNGIIPTINHSFVNSRLKKAIDLELIFETPIFPIYYTVE